MPPSQSRTTRGRALCAAVATIILPTSTIQATVATWTGSGMDSKWSTPENWLPVSAPSNDGTADLIFSGNLRPNPQVDSPWSVNSLSFTSSAASFTFSGAPITLGPGGIQNSSYGPQFFNTHIVLASDQSWNAGTQTNSGMQFNSTIDTNGHALTLAGSGPAIYGPITGSGSLIVNSPFPNGVLLRGANTYSGGTYVTGSGQLYVEHDAALGAPSNPLYLAGGGTLVLAPRETTSINRPITVGTGGGIIDFAGSPYHLTLAGTLQGSGPLLIQGSGRVKLTGISSHTGTATIKRVAVEATSDSLPGNVVLGSYDAILDLPQAYNGTYSGNITGGGELNKTGPGTLTITGTVAVAGLDIYAGIIELHNSGSNLVSPFGFGGNLDLTGHAGTVQFVGGATFTSPAVGWFGDGGFAARNGPAIVNLGGQRATVQLLPHNDMVFGSPTANSPLEFQNHMVLPDEDYSPTPTIQVTSGQGGDYTIFSGQISGRGRWQKTGPGTLVLTAQNSFGRLVLADGALHAVDGIGLPANARLQLSGGVLVGIGPATFSRPLGILEGQVNWAPNSSANGGGFAASGGTLTVNIGGNAAPLTWGATSFVPTGKPLILGAQRADAETLFLNPINLGSVQREIRVPAGLGGDSATLAGPLSGTGGGIRKTGAGTLRLLVANTNTGSTSVVQGTLIVGNDTALGLPSTSSLSLVPTSGATATAEFTSPYPSAGFLSSGSTGTAAVLLGNLTGPTSTTLTVGARNISTTFYGTITDLSATHPAATGSLVKVGTGTLTLRGTSSYIGPTVVTAGTLALRQASWAPVLELPGGAELGAGILAFDYPGSASPHPTVLTYLQAAHAAGFAGSRLRIGSPDAFHAIAWLDDPAAARLTLRATWYGDANLNGSIDSDDYALIDRSLAASLPAVWTTGDFNYDGLVDAADYRLLDTSALASGAILASPAFLSTRVAQFGDAYARSLLASIPEPSLLACLGVVPLRRRSRSPITRVPASA